MKHLIFDLFSLIFSDLFSLFFPTRITKFGKSLFFLTNENDYIARKTRIGRMDKEIVYRQTIERLR